MLAAVAGWFGSIWAKVALIGGIALAIVVIVARVLAGAKEDGKRIERAEQRAKIQHAAKEKVKRDAGIDSLPSGELRRRVREQRDELRELLHSE